MWRVWRKTCCFLLFDKAEDARNQTLNKSYKIKVPHRKEVVDSLNHTTTCDRRCDRIYINSLCLWHHIINLSQELDCECVSWTHTHSWQTVTGEQQTLHLTSSGWAFSSLMGRFTADYFKHNFYAVWRRESHSSENWTKNDIAYSYWNRK